jgi:hypothetical protein
MKTTKKLSGAKTKLERHVQTWVNDKARDYDSGPDGVLKDLFHGGCQSGMAGHLIYYKDTLKFFKANKAEISAIFKDSLENSGADGPLSLFGGKWDKDDPLALEDSNQNLLAWFGFEETARNLASRAGIEI